MRPIAGAREGPHASLPAPISTFIGRERDVAELTRLLESARLLTLTGAGGIGKTRLALEVATRVAMRFPHGAALTELAAITDASVVPAVVAAALGIESMPGRSPLEALRAEIGTKRVLLVLDNCEHLLTACAELALDLLRACPGLRILATSRTALNFSGETTWLVPSLSLPPTDADARGAMALDASDAVRLFIERVRAMDRTFAVDARNAAGVAAVCRRLGGIPLAIELAAASTNMLTVSQIAERLSSGAGFLIGPETAEPRHRTLRATVEWSLGLLANEERELFDLVSVFAGSFTLEAAETVAGRDLLTSLGRLVSASLVASGPPIESEMRFRLLEPLRDVARDRLASATEGRADRARDAHARYFLGEAESLQDGLWGRSAPGMLRLELEVDDLRAALRWLVQRGDAERAGRLGAALARFWMYSGRVAEARQRLAELAALDGTSARTRGRILTGAAAAATYDLDHLAAGRLAEAALPLTQGAEDRWATAWAHFALALSSLGLGELGADRVLDLCVKAASQSGAAGDPLLELMSRVTGAMVQTRMGRAVEAEAVAQEALIRAPLLRAPREAARALTCIGLARRVQNDLPGARDAFERALSGWEAEGESAFGFGILLRTYLAALAIDMRDRRRGWSHVIALMGIWSAHGRPRHLAAICLRLFAHVSASESRSAAVVRTCAALIAHAESIVISYPIRATLAASLEAARAALGLSAADAAWAEGSAMSLEQACDSARVEAEQALAAASARRTRRRLVGGLTEREAEVLRLVADGKTNREIAQTLVLSERTVAKHLDHVFTKIGVSTRAAAAAFAVRNGL